MLRGYFLFLLSVLGIIGARDLVTDSKALSRLVILVPILAIAAVLVFVTVLNSAATDHPQYALAIGHAVLLWGGLLLLAFFLKRDTPRFLRFLPIVFVALAVSGWVGGHAFLGTNRLRSRPARALPIPADSSVSLGVDKFARALGDLSGNPNFYFKVPTLRGYEPFRNRFHELIASNPALQAMGLGHDRIWFAPDAPDVSPNPGLAAHFAAALERGARADHSAPLARKNAAAVTAKQRRGRGHSARARRRSC